MPVRTRIAFETPPRHPPVPAWVRTALVPQNHEAASFSAGAALAALHPFAGDVHLLGGLWRQRLALGNAAVLVRQAGRTEGEAALRDAFYLRRPGDDPGPAGKILLVWRKLCEAAALRPQNWGGLHLLAEPLGIGRDGAWQELVTGANAENAPGNPVAAAIKIAAASLRLFPQCENLGFWFADAVLARQLKWPAPLPLIAGFLRRADLRAALHAGESDRKTLAAWSRAYASAAFAAAGLHADLARRAANLIAAAPKLRGKDADERILLLLSQDAQPAASGKTTSERSARRLFDRLEALGVVRELTGRASFRLYGL